MKNEQQREGDVLAALLRSLLRGTFVSSLFASLALANETRLRQLHLRRQLRELTYSGGLELLADMMAAPDEHLDEPLGSLRLIDAVRAIRGIGPARADEILDRSSSHPPNGLRRVRDLTERERRLVAGALRRRAMDWHQEAAA